MELIRMVAIAPEDGWAIIDDSANLLLVRPPYRKDNLAHVSAEFQASAIAKHAFESVDIEFPRWRDLISYLRDKVHAATQSLKPADVVESAATVLASVDPTNLPDFLATVDKVYIQAGLIEQAETVLLGLLSTSSIWRDQHSIGLVVEMLESTKNLRTDLLRERAGVSRTAPLEDRFPNACAAVGTEELQGMSDRIYERENTFAAA